jgi:pyrroline-5-carboxylate reductase
MNITIIGIGVIGKIFLQAIYQLLPKATITITDRDKKKLTNFKKKFSRLKITTDNSKAVFEADLVLLSVKPQQFAEVAAEIKHNLKKDVLVVSVMAGQSLAKINSLLKIKNIVRLMPNLGGRVGRSMTTWTTTKVVNKQQKQLIIKILQGIGQELYVKNDAWVDKTSVVHGCGPGFFFYFIAEWLAAIKKLGFNENEAKKLLLTTLDGSVELLKLEMIPEKLYEQVASKGGSTEAGLKILNNAQLVKLWSKTLQAALKRTKELSK